MHASLRTNGRIAVVYKTLEGKKFAKRTVLKTVDLYESVYLLKNTN